MDITLTEGTNMNMQSQDCKVYNESILLMPYKMKQSVDSTNTDEERVHIWHAGIVSYMLMDFNSEEIHGTNPKYIVEHGHKSVIMDREDIPGTLKQFPEYSDVLKFLQYTPQRPISFFEVQDTNGYKPWDLEDLVNKKYMELFHQKNSLELSEKLIRAYANTVALKEQLMSGHKDMLVIYYGEPNQIFLDKVVETSGLKGNKIYSFNALKESSIDKKTKG